MSVWRVLADAVVVIHYGFLLYLIVGGFLAWRRPALIWPHAVAAIWAVLILTTHVPCPLTAAQNYFRGHIGLAPLREGFIQVYVRGTLYPARAETVVQLLVGAVVVASWLGFVHRWRAPRGDRHPV